MLTIRRAQAEQLGFDLAAAVAEYQAALQAHALTVDIPAPVAHPLVEIIVQRFEGRFQIIPDDPIPAPTVPPLEPVTTISRRQLILGLRRAGLISDQEALDAAALGAVPAVIRAVFDALPPDQKIEAEITWAAMGVVERDNQLVEAVLAATGHSHEDGDALFESWSAL